MIKNIIYTFGILVTLLFYYLFYEHQNTRFLNLNKKLDLITQKIDSLEKGNVSTKPVSIDYKENNIVNLELPIKEPEIFDTKFKEENLDFIKTQTLNHQLKIIRKT